MHNSKQFFKQIDEVPITIAHAMSVLGNAIREDVSPGSYGHVWHCNLVAAFHAALGDTPETYGQAERGAESFMLLCFGVSPYLGELNNPPSPTQLKGALTITDESVRNSGINEGGQFPYSTFVVADSYGTTMPLPKALIENPKLVVTLTDERFELAESPTPTARTQFSTTVLTRQQLSTKAMHDIVATANVEGSSLKYQAGRGTVWDGPMDALASTLAQLPYVRNLPEMEPLAINALEEVLCETALVELVPDTEAWSHAPVPALPLKTRTLPADNLICAMVEDADGVEYPLHIVLLTNPNLGLKIVNQTATLTEARNMPRSSASVYLLKDTEVSMETLNLVDELMPNSYGHMTFIDGKTAWYGNLTDLCFALASSETLCTELGVDLLEYMEMLVIGAIPAPVDKPTVNTGAKSTMVRISDKTKLSPDEARSLGLYRVSKTEYAPLSGAPVLSVMPEGTFWHGEVREVIDRLSWSTGLRRTLGVSPDWHTALTRKSK